MPFLKDLLSKEWFRLLGMLLIGITVGAIFYPTKKVEERLTKKHQEEIQILNEKHAKETTDQYEKYVSVLQQEKTYREESERKITKLSEENRTLKSKTKQSTYKLVKPDGTIEERTFSESEVNESSRVVTKIQEEFKTKVEQIETKWSEIHKERVTKIQKEFDSKEQQYKKTIDELQYSKTTTVNEKHFGIEAGYTSSKKYYGHATYDMWGPIYIGIHGEANKEFNDNNLGAGIGLRF